MCECMYIMFKFDHKSSISLSIVLQSHQYHGYTAVCGFEEYCSFEV